MEKALLKITLFTNLTMVTIGNVRIHAHALMLEESHHTDFGDGARLRGFFVGGSTPVVDMFLKTTEHKLTRAVSNALLITDTNPEPRPLAQGAILEVLDGPTVELMTMDHQQDLLVEKLELSYVKNEPDESEKHRAFFDNLWLRMAKNIASFWQAPNMPTVSYEEANWVRSVLARAKVLPYGW